MSLDFSDFFQRYEAVTAEVDAIFTRVASEHPRLVRCGDGCSDCCLALFDITFIEGLYLNYHFNKQFSGTARSELLDRADRADRRIQQIKRDAFRASRQGMRVREILDMIGKSRVRCPLLSEENNCLLYDYRPVNCRLYGIPTASEGIAHTCTLSRFAPGIPYPTVHMEKVHDRLLLLSRELVETLPTKNEKMFDMLIPVSMALMNSYDENFLGLMDEKEHAGQTKKQEKQNTLLHAARQLAGHSPVSGMSDIADIPHTPDTRQLSGADHHTAHPPFKQAEQMLPGQAAQQLFDADANASPDTPSGACTSCDGTLQWELGKTPATQSSTAKKEST